MLAPQSPKALVGYPVVAGRLPVDQMAHVAQVARHGEVPDAFHGEQRTVREARGLPRRRSRRRIEDHGAVALFAHDVGVVVGYMDEHLVVRRVRALGERAHHDVEVAQPGAHSTSMGVSAR